MTDPTLPPDIAAAIDEFDGWARSWGYQEDQGVGSDVARTMAKYERARAALEAAILGHLGGGWRPIASVPKDERKVMLYRPLAGETSDPVITIRRTTKTSQHCWPDTIPPGCDGQNFTEGSCYATHWMPLPSPPATDLGRAALAEDGRE